MTAILLAATQRDGHQVMREAPWTVGEIVAIVTPQSAERVRGLSVTHILRTTLFILLPAHEREPVEQVAAPAIALSNCPHCTTHSDHPLVGSDRPGAAT